MDLANKIIWSGDYYGTELGSDVLDGLCFERFNGEVVLSN